MKTILFCALAGLAILLATVPIILLVGLVGSVVEQATGSNLLAVVSALAVLGLSTGAAAGLLVLLLENE